MSRAERFVELWNEGRVEEALGPTTSDYSYTDPVLGGPHDRDAHVAMMREIYETMPDRRITIDRCWVTPEAEFIEYTWRATSPSGEPIEHRYFGVLEYAPDGRAARQRHFAM